MILYYKDENDLHHPSGIIYLHNGTIKRNVSEPKREFCFQITTHKRKEIILQANDEKMKENWCNLLESTILKITKDYECEINDLTNEYEKTKLENLGLEKQIELVSKSANSLKGILTNSIFFFFLTCLSTKTKLYKFKKMFQNLRMKLLKLKKFKI